MPQRLVERYNPGDLVEIYLEAVSGRRWQSGHVLALDHPGVWVETEDGRRWFVTHGRRIRPQQSPAVHDG